MRSSLGIQIGSFLALLALWHLAAVLAKSSLLPNPVMVIEVIGEAIASGELPYHLAITLMRVLASFILAMVIGTAIGIAMGWSRSFNRLFDPWLVFFLNIPALVLIILIYVWFGLIEIAAVSAVALNKIPNVAVTLREGTRALDKDYQEMARSFRLGFAKTMVHVILPQLYPYLAATARSGLALIWKIVLVVELLGRGNGMGFQLHLFFQLFDITNILAYSLSFIIVMQAIELVLFQPAERRISRWRR